MQIAPGIYSMGQDKGGHVHAYLLDDGTGLTLPRRARRGR
jgi:hypothetical protein